MPTTTTTKPTRLVRKLAQAAPGTYAVVSEYFSALSPNFDAARGLLAYARSLSDVAALWQSNDFGLWTLLD